VKRENTLKLLLELVGRAGMLLAFSPVTWGEKDMQPTPLDSAKLISLDRTTFRAVKCDKCGAKMYPQSLLEPHLTRHRRRHRWFKSEMKKLQFTFSHMRDIA
jgi:hypothetical protein